MTVIPGDKFCGTKRVFGVNTRNIEPSIFDCTGCKYDDIVISAQLFEMNVRAVFYVSNKPYITAIHDAVQSFHDAFDSRMVGSHTVTNQTKRCWVTIKKIYCYVEINIGFLQQISVISTSRTGTDDSNPQWQMHSFVHKFPFVYAT